MTTRTTRARAHCAVRLADGLDHPDLIRTALAEGLGPMSSRPM